MVSRPIPFSELLSVVIDNRGKTCPTADTGMPLIATNCIKDDQLYPVFEKVRYVTDETRDSWFRGHPEPNDIIFVCKGSPGRVAWTPSPVPFCIAQDMLALRADENIVNSKFLFALLRSEKTKRQISNMHVGTMIPHFKKGDFKNLYLDIPKCLETQKYIGEMYFILSRKIELNRQINQTLESMAQALFKSWFVDFDPVIDNALAAGNPIPEALLAKADTRRALQQNGQTKPLPTEIQNLFPDSFTYTEEMGWIPKGWGIKLVKDVVSAVYDGPHATPKKSTTGPIFLGIKNLTGSALSLSEIRHIDESDWSRWTKRVTPQHGDIVFSYEATLGFFALIPPNTRCCLGRRLALVRPLEDQSLQHFWFHQFISLPFQQQLAKRTIQGATVNRIPLTEFPSFFVLDPDGAIKIAFEHHATSVWERIHSTQSQIAELEKLRDTLLPKLISGELRIPDAEKLVAEAGL